MALGLYVNQAGKCHVKVRTLGAILGTDIRNVKRYLRALEKAGYLKSSPQFWPDGRQRENNYEVVVGGWSAPTTPGGATTDHPNECVLERVQAKPGAAEPHNVEEMMDWNSESPPATLPEKSKRTAPPSQKAPPKKARLRPKGAVGLAWSFACKSERRQPEVPCVTTAVAGELSRWRKLGATDRELEEAIKIFWSEFEPAGPPAWKVFIKTSSVWVDKAKEALYQRRLPKLKVLHERMWDEIVAEHDAWKEANPGATKLESDAVLAHLWEEKQRLPQYAPCYA